MFYYSVCLSLVQYYLVLMDSFKVSHEIMCSYTLCPFLHIFFSKMNSGTIYFSCRFYCQLVYFYIKGSCDLIGIANSFINRFNGNWNFSNIEFLNSLTWCLIYLGLIEYPQQCLSFFFGFKSFTHIVKFISVMLLMLSYIIFKCFHFQIAHL